MRHRRHTRASHNFHVVRSMDVALHRQGKGCCAGCDAAGSAAMEAFLMAEPLQQLLDDGPRRFRLLALSSFFLILPSSTLRTKGARPVVFLVPLVFLRFAGLHAPPSQGLVVARRCAVLQEGQATKGQKARGT